MAELKRGSQLYIAKRDELYFRRFLRLGCGCRLGECARNRAYDPFCLCRLVSSDDSPQVRVLHGNRFQLEPPTPRAVPAGLQNISRICYMNSVLQALFYILPVRQILYEWRMPPPEQQVAGRRYQVVIALKKLFVLLQTTRQVVVDPTEFVQAAQLDAGKEEDAQEFTLSILNLLDSVFADDTAAEKLRSLFGTRLLSIITCRECKEEFSTEESVNCFSISIDHISDLKDGLKLFLEGDVEKYACAKCGSNQKARMKKQLSELPRILLIDLKRVIFDKNMATKLIHPVDFPISLDLRPFLNKDQTEEWGVDGCVYELRSALLHASATADSGHYIARISVTSDDEWYTFNDELVFPCKRPGEDESDYRSVYMLIYERKRDIDRYAHEPPIPSDVATWEIDPADLVKRLKSLKKTLQNGGIDILKCLKALSGKSVIWLPIDWLQDLVLALADPTDKAIILPPDLKKSFCDHGGLKGIEGLKATDKTQTEALFMHLGMDPFLFAVDGDSFCVECNWNLILRGIHGRSTANAVNRLRKKKACRDNDAYRIVVFLPYLITVEINTYGYL